MSEVSDIKDMEPNAELVGMLRRLLDHAEKGELRTSFCVNGWADDAVSSGWQRDKRTTANRFLGGMVRATMDFITTLNLADEHSGTSKLVEEIADERIYS